MQTLSALLKKITTGLFMIIMGIAVLGILPITDNFVYETKSFGLFFLTLLLLFAFLIRGLLSRKLKFVLAPYTIALVGFGVAVLLSSFASNSYPVENLMSFGGVYVSMVLFAVLGGTLLSKMTVPRVLQALAVFGSLLTVTNVLEVLGVGPSQFYNQVFNLSLPNNLLFNLAGSSFIAAQILLVTLIGIIADIVSQRKISKLFALTLPILVIGLGVTIWALLPGKPAQLQLPSFTASWSIALDSIRQPRSALIGVGPAGYPNAYLQFKPLWVNGTDVWNVRFPQAANVPLTILSSMGFIGLITWIALVVALLKQLKPSSSESKPYMWMIATIVVLQLIFPTNVPVVTLLGVLIAVVTASNKHLYSILNIKSLSVDVSRPEKEENFSRSPVTVVSPFGILSVFLMLIVGVLFYMTGRAYAGQMLLAQSRKAAVENDGVTLYEKQQRAVALNPYLDEIRRQYATTNLLIAISLSNKTDLTEQEQQQVSQLLQQAIREARSATLLDPNDSQNWLVLAQIYQNIIAGVPEAAQWSVQSYVRAIETNPTDPTLRLALGGVFLGQNEVSQAASLFQQAAELKVDFPNAYFNLAVALKELGQYQAAKQAYQQVLVLIDPVSDDYVLVTQQLEELEALIAEQAESAEATASAQPVTTPNIIDQNIENEANLINNPSTTDIDVPENLSTPSDATQGNSQIEQEEL